MKRLYRLLVAMVALAAMPGMDAWSQFDYSFTVGTGEAIDLDDAGWTSVHGGGTGARGQTGVSRQFDLPFTFMFDEKEYKSVWVTPMGVIALGDDEFISTGNNELTAPNRPVIAAFWEQMRHASRNTGRDGRGATTVISTVGKTPFRIFVVDYMGLAFGWGNGPTRASFQIRLYEGTNKIEFYYSEMNPYSDWGNEVSTSASIGIAGGKGRFISVTPYGSDAEANRDNVNDYVDIMYGNPIDTDVLFTFTPCQIDVAGNTSEGGTAGMGSGDNLLSGKKSERYRASSFTPFDITFDPSCSSREYSLTLGGPSASEYKLSQTSGTIYGGERIPINIQFTPTGAGPRTATLTVRDDKNFNRTYNLVAEGTPRLVWTGNTASGGTATVAHGDILLNGVRVPRLSSRDFMPITFGVPSNPPAPTAPITYTINDRTGQYKVRNPLNGQLVNTYTFNPAQGTSVTPTIVFTATGVGTQRAELTVNGEGDVRVYPLQAYSIAPGGNFFLNGEQLGPESSMFQKDFTCVGDNIQTYPVSVTNIGDGDFKVTDVQVFLTDTVYGQGAPRYPLRRDFNGNPIPVHDYFVTDFPGTAPISGEQAQFPITTPFLGTKTIYFNYVPQRPGKRFARAFIYTNGENFTNVDPNGNTVLGLLVLDMFGRGIGATPSDAIGQFVQPRPVVFTRTMVGDTAQATMQLCNSGLCDLRIDRKMFRITSGDTREFRITNAFADIALDMSGGREAWVIPPDSCATITFSFIPNGKGARRATVMLQTNDSSLVIDGMTERGALYWDLFGTGSIGIDARDLQMGPGVIDGPLSGNPKGDAEVENNTRDYVVIDSMKIVGPDAGEFEMDPSRPWPATPFGFKPGEIIDFGVVHNPEPGSAPGRRNARLILFTSDGDSIVVEIHGESAARTLVAEPGALFSNVSIRLGRSVRQTLMITNNGSVPVRLGTTVVTGPNFKDYIIGKLPRLTLAPGQSEFLEITYRPLDPGVSSAVLTINSDATNGPLTVQLGGTATSIRPTDDQANATSGVSTTEKNGVLLRQTRPNPARDIVELNYSLENDGEVSLTLFDDRGAEIRTLDRGPKTAGDHTLQVDVVGLPSGVYHYRLTANGVTLSRTLTVVR